MRRPVVPMVLTFFFTAAPIATAEDKGPNSRTEGRANNRPSNADAEASRLLAAAREARARWRAFPGFTAAAEVSLSGKISRGRVRVEPTGKVKFEGLDRPAEAWAFLSCPRT